MLQKITDKDDSFLSFSKNNFVYIGYRYTDKLPGIELPNIVSGKIYTYNLQTKEISVHLLVRDGWLIGSMQDNIVIFENDYLDYRNLLFMSGKKSNMDILDSFFNNKTF